MTCALGIDFGTMFSCMAWLDPSTGQPKILENAEGEAKTPSLVYFGEHETLVGIHAHAIMLEDEIESQRVFVLPKRRLGSGFAFLTPDGRPRTAEDAAAAIFAKLKTDAEELHLHQPIKRAVLTCPASFGPAERDALTAAARRAGFSEVCLLEEPVAAGLAFAAEREIGRVLLVYDLGGGTFDAAVLARDGEGMRLALEARGMADCGGEDFDRDLYAHAVKTLGAAASFLPEDDFHPQLLAACRGAKESLSRTEKGEVKRAVKGRILRCHLTRVDFERLILDRIAKTVELTARLASEAKSRGYMVETALLIGGSSRIPLVQRLVAEALGLPPRKTAFADFAVAHGAAREGAEREAPTKVNIGHLDPFLGVRPGSGGSFKDIDMGPEMVVVPAGEFWMGSPDNEPGLRSDEGPRHRVTIARPFAVGRYAVTLGEFSAFADETGYSTPDYAWTFEGWVGWKSRNGRSFRNPGFAQDASHPVVCVNWHDAQAYVNWLSKKTGKQYRLLSEAEWEYAARAGTSAGYWWGDSITSAQANYGMAVVGTVPVNRFQPNGWGLYQVHGNVLEWCADNWHGDYKGAPADGSAWFCRDAAAPRVSRGGSWFDSANDVHAACRNNGDPALRAIISAWADRRAGQGFRCARVKG